MPSTAAEIRLIEAAKRCCERWGFERVTIDDIAQEAGISRATLYRIFPGGKDVLFEAMRLQELEHFFNELLTAIGDADNLEELLVRAVASAMRAMRADAHLAIMLAAAPGETLGELTVTGLPRTIRVATTFLMPLAERFLSTKDAGEVVELLVRLVISGFLAPSSRIDFSVDDDVRTFVRKLILPAYTDAALAAT